MAKGDKYKKFTKYLVDSNKDRVILTFEELEKITGGLPPSVYNYRSSWSDKSQHSFSYGWLRAGYSVQEDFANKRAIFTKVSEPEDLPINMRIVDEKIILNKIVEDSLSIPIFQTDNKDDSNLNMSMILSRLKEKRFAFHSEADFQFQLAWTIKELYLDRADILLEAPNILNGKKAFIDIVVMLDNNKIIPIELKYKTKKSSFESNKNKFNLGNQSAHDLGNFDYLTDIERIETYRSQNYGFSEGYAIMITNDPLYTKITNSDTKNKEFSIGHKEIKKGLMTWRDDSSIYKDNHRKPSIELKSEYEMNWSIFGSHKHSNNMITNFYILINKINKI